MPPALEINTGPGQTQRMDTMVRVISPERLISKEQSDEAKRKAEQEQAADEQTTNLAHHVRGLWWDAYQAKHTSNNEQGSVQDRLLKAIRQRLGIYDPEKLGEIRKFGGSEIYMLISNIKCRACESWLEDLILPPGEIPFDIEPTAIPDLPGAEEVNIAEEVSDQIAEFIVRHGPEQITENIIRDALLEAKEAKAEEINERAKTAARFQARKIEDEFQEGGFYSALKDFLNDISTFPTAFMEGPFIRRERCLRWVEDGKGGFIPQIYPVLKRKYARISPFDVYPSSGAKHIQDGGLFVRRRLRPNQLHDMIGVPGFSEQNIRGTLDDYGNNGLREWIIPDQERSDAYAQTNEQNDPHPIIDALQYWGSIQGDLLREWGMSEKDIPDPQKSYDVTVWLVGTWVICARLNPNPLGERPIYAASYEQVVDSIWGKGPPELMKDIQDVCNAAARNAVNNMAIASGPLVEANMDRVQPGEDVEDIYPWKVLKSTSDPMGGSGPAYQFYQPNPMTESLMSLYKDFFTQASEQTGIPQYVYGSDRSGSGASETATGLSMLMNAAGKVLKGVVKNIDDRVIKKVVYQHWLQIMLYDKDELKIGDINIVARASEHLIMEEIQQIRLTEYLNSTNNPWDERIIGDKGRAALQRKYITRFLRFPSKEVIPTEQELEDREQMMAEAAQAQMQAEAMEQPPQGGGSALMPDGSRPGEQTRMAA